MKYLLLKLCYFLRDADVAYIKPQRMIENECLMQELITFGYLKVYNTEGVDWVHNNLGVADWHIPKDCRIPDVNN